MNYKTALLLILATLALYLPTTWAFALGLAFAMCIGNPHQTTTAKMNKTLLQVCVVGLGFGMNAHDAFAIGADGVILTIATIAITITTAIYLGRRLALEPHVALLIGSGTAICGGSAIAAVAATINAKPSSITLALSTVFALNAVALFLFPALGGWLGLSQEQFGLWAAIAIHDTSSVVGAAQVYGERALDIATATKLQRALWIIPLVLVISHYNRANATSRVSIPWFIFVFVLAITINSLIPEVQPYTENIAWLAKKGLTVTLFLVGASFSLTKLKTVGTKPLLLALILWSLISIASLLAIIVSS